MPVPQDPDAFDFGLQVVEKLFAQTDTDRNHRIERRSLELFVGLAWIALDVGGRTRGHSTWGRGDLKELQSGDTSVVFIVVSSLQSAHGFRSVRFTLSMWAFRSTLGVVMGRLWTTGPRPTPVEGAGCGDKLLTQCIEFLPTAPASGQAPPKYSKLTRKILPGAFVASLSRSGPTNPTNVCVNT